MAAPTIQVDVVSAEGELFSGPAEVVFAPGSQGDLGIHPRHAPLLTLLKPGEVRVKTADRPFWISAIVLLLVATAMVWAYRKLASVASGQTK